MSLSINLLNKRIFVKLFVVVALTTFYNQSFSQSFVKGADGSVLDQIEQSGGIFYDQGAEADAYEIFKKNGFNNIRLKLWHTPAEPYNDLARVLVMAKRAKDLGLSINLDFHYSDTWADPGHQTKPAAWVNLPFNTLQDSIYAYTKYVIGQLKAQNTLPEYVQVGNETNCGMLWDDGKVCNPDTPEQWEKFGTLIKSAIEGIEDALDSEDDVKIILHIADGANNGVCRWWFDNILDEGVEFDIIGLSFYPWWHGTLSNLKSNLNDLSTRYEKDIIIVEAAYPWTLAWNDNTNNIIGSTDQLHEGYPATVNGQFRYLRDLIEIIKSTTGKRGKGIMYWSPEWISAPQWGSPWENVSLFDFDNEVLESIKAFDDNTNVSDLQNNNVVFNTLPNPFTTELNLVFNLQDRAEVKIILNDLTGKKIKELVESNLSKGPHNLTFETGNLKPGVYLLSISVNEKNYFQKVIKSD